MSMETFRRQKGQTIIETAFILTLLLLILLGITEFARAWYIKNSLKNSVRQGARVGAVTTNNSLPANFTCDNSTNCDDTNLNPIIRAVCCQPGVPRRSAPENTTVTLECKNESNTVIACNIITTGGTVRVQAVTTFFTIVSSFSPWIRSINMTTDASMRYE